ncbi:MAG: ribonuclease HI family protein [Actinomycetota bacterium]|nr:ribonuclease HI family protein [Actinomycetota bacterium]
MARCVLRTDGGARGNPGPAGAGFVLADADGAVVCQAGRFLGEATNNIAEYEALVWGLENAHVSGFDTVTVYADSELVVKQINGVYRVKHPNLRPLFVRTMELLRGFSSFEVIHVRREQNADADALANQAMDLRRIVGNPTCEPGQTVRADTLFE